ncbi:MAG: right-handed parallel beta-helix repeat-containing protein, partial [Anaerolineae bacterium]
IWEGPQFNTIGGATPDARNIISGNEHSGVHIGATGADHNTVSGNYIGPSADGTTIVGNGGAGVIINSDGQYNTIGGSTSGERNIISGNFNGVVIQFADASHNVVKGNYIGTDATATHAWANSVFGVWIHSGAHDNEIGPDNVIAYNNVGGVDVYGDGTTGNTITQNSIHSNEGEGISLRNGGNNERDAPTITSAMCSYGTGTTDPSLTVEGFSDLDGQGRFYEGAVGSGLTGSFVFYPAGDAFRYPYVTLTATDTVGNTSEFSDPVRNGCPIVFLPFVMKR